MERIYELDFECVDRDGNEFHLYRYFTTESITLASEEAVAMLSDLRNAYRSVSVLVRQQ